MNKNGKKYSSLFYDIILYIYIIYIFKVFEIDRRRSNLSNVQEIYYYS